MSIVRQVLISVSHVILDDTILNMLFKCRYKARKDVRQVYYMTFLGDGWTLLFPKSEPEQLNWAVYSILNFHGFTGTIFIDRFIGSSLTGIDLYFLRCESENWSCGNIANLCHNKNKQGV